MKKSLPYILIPLLVIVLGISFYWYELRPSAIIKKCSLESTYSAKDWNFLKELKNRGFSADEALKKLEEVKRELKTDTEIENEKKYNFQKCLRDNGILE